MKISRKLYAFLASVLLLLAVFNFAACSQKDKAAVSIGAMNGPTMIGLAKLDRDARDGKNAYAVEKVSTPAEITAGLVNKKYDAAALSCSTAAILFNTPGMDIQIAAVNCANVFYMLTNGITIDSFGDLKGQTIYMSGLGAVPEYVIRYLLEKNGLTDVEIVFRGEPTQIIPLLIKGDIKIAMLPQPAATTALVQGGGKVKESGIDFTAEWKKIEGNSDKDIITGVLVVRKAFLKNNKEAFDRFLGEYKASVDFMKDAANLDAAAELITALEIIPALPIAKTALPKCGLTYIDGAEMKDKVSAFLQTMYGQNAESVGGKMPGEEFYY